MTKNPLYKAITLGLYVVCLFSSHTTANPAPSAENRSFSFALISDQPYDVYLGDKDRRFDKLVKQINSDVDIAWVLHLGDIKTGTSSCTNRFLKERKNRFEKFQPAFVLTPGDNEWTDCHRLIAGAFDPLERLNKLREIFFSYKNEKLEMATNNLHRQAETHEQHQRFVENLSWQKQRITFSTIHMVGSLNGTKPFKNRNETHDAEVEARNLAAFDWLTHTFEQAKQKDSSGIFIAIHANPGFDNLDKQTYKAVYGAFINKLRSLTKKFKKPVVLAHGDSHIFRIDQPDFFGKRAPNNFIRLESFGDSNGSWIKVTADPNAVGVFSFSAIRN
ncbi:MAG: metallophosphoesterase [Agarilytica sp.]